MTIIVYVILLAFVFAALIGFSAATFFFGLVLAIGIVNVLPKLPEAHSLRIPNIPSGPKLLRFLWNVFVFLFDFLRDLAISNIVIAIDVWTPAGRYRPELIYVPVGDLSHLEISLLATRITLTPGTLSCDVTEDGTQLIVHSMYPEQDHDKEARKLRQPIDLIYRGLEFS